MPYISSMKKQVLEALTKCGTLVNQEAIDHICKMEDPMGYIEDLTTHHRELPLIITLEELVRLEKEKAWDVTQQGEDGRSGQKAPEEIEEVVSKPGVPETTGAEPSHSSTPSRSLESPAGFSNRRPIAADYEPQITVFKDITGESTCEGNIDDFTKYFKDRYRVLRRILASQRREVAGAVPMAKIGRLPGQVKVIGIVSDVRISRNNYKIINLEDESGNFTVLIGPDSPLYEVNVIEDEVLGFVGKVGGASKDLLYPENMVRPEVPLTRVVNRASEPLSAAFISDMHLGSNTFLEKEWSRFLDWLNGKGKDSDIASRIKYLVACGDVVDGIGQYPNHEDDLAITDVYAQYEALAEHLKSVPDHIKVIIIPGNHDAVRPAEPQPALPDEIVKLFDTNTDFYGNPCSFSIHGVNILAYHGRSMDDFITKFTNLTYSNPLESMKEMLVRRHLVPCYGDKTPIAPESKDMLVIDTIPDIFVTGHVHAAGITSYRKITLISASTWQSQTDYQRMRNFAPDPAKVAVVELDTSRYQMLSFM